MSYITTRCELSIYCIAKTMPGMFLFILNLKDNSNFNSFIIIAYPSYICI